MVRSNLGLKKSNIREESDLTLIDESDKSYPFTDINFDCRISRVQLML